VLEASVSETGRSRYPIKAISPGGREPGGRRSQQANSNPGGGVLVRASRGGALR